MKRARSRLVFRVLSLVVAFVVLFAPLAPILPAAAAPPDLDSFASSAASPTPRPIPSSPTTRSAPSTAARPRAVTAAMTSAIPCGASVPSVDLPQYRTRTSRTYQGTNGGLQTVVCTDSINYQDASGAWQPIDDTLVAATTTGYAYQNGAKSFTALFPATLSGNPIKVTKGNSSVTFQLVGATAASGAVSGSTITYNGSLPSVNAAYTVVNDGVKESLTLQNASAPSSYAFTVTASSGLTAKPNVSGEIDFVDAQGVAQLSFAPPYLQDSSTTSPSTSAATLSLAQAGSALTVTITPSATWLASPARVWPVTLDPQVTVNPSLDCYIQGGSGSSTNNCTGLALQVGYNGTNVNRSLLQFDLSAVPYDATVLDGQLQLRLDTAYGAGSSTVEAHQLTQSWTSAVTWNTYNGTTDWNSPGGGGDFSQIVVASTSVNVGGTGSWSTWGGLASAIQGWVNGSSPNLGLLLKENSESGNALFLFDSSETTAPPALKINWKHWTGELDYWTYFEHNLTDRSHVEVNVANGNLVLHNSDLLIAGTGMPFDLERHYNSDSNDTWDVGMSWTISYGQGFNLDSSGSSGITLNGPNGYAVFFQKNGSSYTTPPGIDADLVKNQDNTFTLTWHATGTKDNFAAASQGGISSLTSVVDKNGNAISLTYNATTGIVQTITDTQGRQISISTGVFNGQTYISKIVDWTGRNVQYSYDSNHHLTDYWDAAGNHTIYAYTGNNVTKITDGRGNATDITYNTSCGGNGNAVCSIMLVTGASGGGDSGPIYKFQYTQGATPNTVVTDPNGNATTYYYDTLGRVTQIRDASSNSEYFTWTSDNHLATAQDFKGNTTTYTYSTDGYNNLTKIQLPQTVSGTAAASVSWTYTDATHPFYPTTYTDAQGNVLTYTYDTPGNVHTIADQLASQNAATINHNTNGTISSTVDFNGNTTSYSYDTAGNLTRITPPTIQSGQGTQLGVTNVTPDSLSRPGTIQDGKGNNTVYGYDAMDRTKTITYSADTTLNITNTYDADGNLTSRQDNVGTTSFAFDALNRETQKTLPGATGTCPTATTGVHCFAYDAASNLTSYLAATATVANCNGLTYSVSVCYTYNTLNELTSLVDPTTRTTTFGYDLNHRRTTTTYPGNTVQTVTYDNAARVSGVTAVNGTTTLTDYSYAYSKTINSVLTDTLLVQSSSQSDTAGHNATVADTYNALNRLTEWNVTVPTGSLLTAHDYQYTYDGNGNRTQIHISASNVTNLFYNADNEWYQSTDASNNVNLISWDAAGNMTGNNGFGGISPPLTVTYNAREQVATQTDIHQTTSPMTFTGTREWERTADTDTNGSHTYAYDFLGMTRAVGSTATYVRDPYGNLVAQVPSSGGPYYYLTDGQGSVAGLVDPSGNQAASYFYCPTGNPADGPFGTAAAGNPFQYDSAYYDSSFQSYWMDGQQFDSNSGNAFALNMSPDQLQAEVAPFPWTDSG